MLYPRFESEAEIKSGGWKRRGLGGEGMKIYDRGITSARWGVKKPNSGYYTYSLPIDRSVYVVYLIQELWKWKLNGFETFSFEFYSVIERFVIVSLWKWFFKKGFFNFSIFINARGRGQILHLSIKRTSWQ